MAAAKAALLCFLLMAVALAATPGAVEAATCSPTELTPCAPAIIGNAAPSAACCGKLKAHPASCLCKYKKDPNLQRYVNSPNGKKVFAACSATSSLPATYATLYMASFVAVRVSCVPGNVG